MESGTEGAHGFRRIIQRLRKQPAEQKRVPTRSEIHDESPFIIDEQASHAFLKEGTHHVNFLKIAHDSEGNKWLLKTDPFLQHSARPMSQEEYQARIEALQNEEKAYRIAKYIGAPMAETRFVQVGGKPFSAARFIEGADDKRFGYDLEIDEENPEIRSQQELQLAYGALLKFLLEAEGDQGQYLQDQAGKIYIMDIGIKYDVRPVSNISDLFNKIAAQSEGKGNYFHIIRRVLDHQLQGISAPEFQTTLQKLEMATSEEFRDLLSIHPNEKDIELASTLAQRASYARRIFNTLAHNKKDAIGMLNPYEAIPEPPLSEGIYIRQEPLKRTYSEEQSQEARMILEAKLVGGNF